MQHKDKAKKRDKQGVRQAKTSHSSQEREEARKERKSSREKAAGKAWLLSNHEAVMERAPGGKRRSRQEGKVTVLNQVQRTGARRFRSGTRRDLLENSSGMTLKT